MMKPIKIGLILPLYLLLITNPAIDIGAQPCAGIFFTFEHYEPCHFRAQYSSTNDCFTEIRYTLESGTFASWSVNSAAGFTADEISPSEIWIHHNAGFLPIGDQVPLLFTLVPDLNTNMLVAYLDDCAQIGCEIFGGIPIESCSDPQDASITGVVYLECGSLPFIDQPSIPDWPIQLLDEMGNVLFEQVTDANGAYAFYDLHAGNYVVKAAQLPDWTPNLPASGEYPISLTPSAQAERNFGNCRAFCLCTSIQTNVQKISTGFSACCYSLSTLITGGGEFCFQHINVQVDAGTFISPSSVQPGWTVNQINPQWIEILPPNGVIPNGSNSPVTFCVSGNASHDIFVSAGFNDSSGAHSCDNLFSFTCDYCNCNPPNGIAVSDIGLTTATLNWTPAPCSESTWFYLEDENGNSKHISRPSSESSLVLDSLEAGTVYLLHAFSLCDTIMSGSSDTMIFRTLCSTDCSGNLVVNGGFDGSIWVPTGPNQIDFCPGWQSNPGTGDLGDWYAKGVPIFNLPNYPGTFYNESVQQYQLLSAQCARWYAGIDLNNCEGTLTQLPVTLAKGSGFELGFWWTPREKLNSQYGYNSFSAYLTDSPCNLSNNSSTCIRLCPGINDYMQIKIPFTANHQPGTWYYFSYAGKAANNVNYLMISNSMFYDLDNYIYIDEVCLRKVFYVCNAGNPRIHQSPDQPNAFLGETYLGPGSELVSAVWNFGDGTQDSSCCLGSVIHDFMPGTYEVCLTVTAIDTSGVTCSSSTCTEVEILSAPEKCDSVAVFLLDSGSGSCCYELKTLVTQPNCFTQLDITLSSGDFTNTQFGPGWNISTNGNTVSLTPSAGGFIPVGQDMPVIICAPNGNDPYTVDIDFVYNGGTCHQTRNFSCFPPIDSCCTDSIAFITVAMGVGTNEVYGDCTISVESVGLGDCMQISWDWGDGTQEGPYTGNTPLTHNYSGNGPHTVCYTIEEVDINGNPCWELEQCLPYSVHCNDTCTCLGFSNLSFSYGPGPVYDWEIPVDCENNPAQLLPCIPSDGYYNFTGDFGCSNDCISSIQYAIYQNSNPLSAGLVNYTGGPSYFSVPSVKFPPGTYELILTGLCGINDTCFCTITFTIPDCPGPCHVNLSSTQNADCTVTISASTTGPQPISYKWCDGRTDSTFTVYQTPCTTQTYCVTITCADGSTSTAVLPVTTVDAIPPIALCKPAAMVSLDTNCTYKVTVAFVDNGSSDNCGIQFMSVSPSSLIGCVDTSVVLTVTDSCGNTSSCSMNIQTKESTPPEIHCPQDTTIYGFITPNGQCIAPYFAPSISATDNCDNNVLVTNNAGTLLSEGTNTITYTATDDCENQSNCSYVVTVVCDTCACGSFSDLFARPSVGAPSIQLSCGGMYDFGCPPPGFSIPITGKFECQGNNCPITTNIIYTLVGPNQQSSTGFVQASPYFYLPIPPANYAQSGVYILTLQGSCGGQDCDSCVISFAVDCPDPCPCDKPKFHAEVDKGFAVSHHINACKACFSPIGLNDCDEVEWKVDGGPVVGTSAGKQSFCHTFPGGASSYVIEMIVTRKTSTGEICDVYGHSQTVAITCTNWQDCNNSVFPNPKFTEGSQSGKMSGDGKTDGWYAPCGDPVVWEGIPPGTNNGWTIQLTGNLDSADVLSTIDPVCLEKMAGSGSLRVNIWWWFDEMLKWCPPTADDKLIIQLYRGDVFEMNDCDGINCYELISIPLPNAIDTGWFEIEFPYDLSDWAELDNCGGPIFGVNVRPAIYVTNSLGSEQGISTRANMFIDNFCLDGVVVAVHNPYTRYDLQVVPNPNTGAFTLVLPEPVKPGTTYTIRDVSGRMFETREIAGGLSNIQVQTEWLPQGMYFISLNSEGRKIGITKFIKH